MIKEIFHYFILKSSRLFDRDYYINEYSDVAEQKLSPIIHFIKYGWLENRNPSKDFNTKFYLDEYPDIKKANLNPLIHYIRYGQKEGRYPLPTLKRQDKPDDELSTKEDSNIMTNDSNEPVEKADEQMKIKNKAKRQNPEKTITIFLHVGQGKTGTSVIQNFLDSNREILFTDHDCLYPNFAEKDLSSGRCHNHERWYRSVEKKRVAFAKDINRMIEYSKQHSISKVILSFEGWDLDRDFQKKITNVVSRHKLCKLRVIYYIRRVDHLVQSSWKQWGIHKFDNIKEYYSLPHFINRYENTYNSLEKWIELLKTDCVILHPYEKQQLTGGLLDDFMSIIGIDIDKHEWKKTENTYMVNNPGFTRDVLEVAKLCLDLYDEKEKYRLFGLFYSSLGDDFLKKPYEEYSFLSPLERLYLLLSNAPYEEKIAKEFLHRDKIFFEPWPNLEDPWKPYEGLTLEKVIPILIKLIDENNRLIRKINKRPRKK